MATDTDSEGHRFLLTPIHTDTDSGSHRLITNKVFGPVNPVLVGTNSKPMWNDGDTMFMKPITMYCVHRQYIIYNNS